MNEHKKRILTGFTALVLAGQLVVPTAVFARPAALNVEGDVAISETFSDPKLQSWLLNGSNLAGAGMDGILTEEERLAVTTLDLSGLGLTSLEGLSAFPNLRVLNCARNNLTELDLSKNPALENLSCAYNQLRELNLSANRDLKYLNCNFNRLKALSLAGHSKLTALYCEMNLLESLDLTGCESLLTLYCRNNLLPALDLSDAVNLEFIETFDNRLTSIDVSHLEKLRFLHIDHNRLTELDMSHNRQLEGGGFVARNNFMEKIFLPDQPGLTVYLDDYAEQDPIEGHDKAAWYLDEAYTQPAPEELEAQGQTLYSKRLPNAYTIYFSANGGSGAMAAVHTQWDQELALPENQFSRTGYQFAGWSTYPGDDTQIFEDQAVVRNLAGAKTDGDRVTLYANWKANTYQIKLMPNGGQEAETVLPAAYGQVVTLPQAPFTNADEDLEFAGWSLTPEGRVRYPDGAAVQNLTVENGGTVALYAVWKTSASALQRPYLAQLEDTYQRLAAAGQEANYTQEDWETLTDVYSEAAEAVRAAYSEPAMKRAAENGCSSMEAVPTLEQRIDQVTDGWRREYRQALAMAEAGALTESSAAAAAELAEQALAGLERLENYSTLRGEERVQVAGQASIRLEPDATDLRVMEKAADWLISLQGLSLRDPSLVRSADMDAYQSTIASYETLEEAVRHAVSDSVLQALTQRQDLAGQKRSESALLQEFYDSIDLNLYSDKGQAALAAALQEGLEAIDGAHSEDAVMQAGKDARMRISQVPTAGEEPVDPPAPPAGGGDGGSTGGSGGSAGGNSGGGNLGGGIGPQEPEEPASEVIQVTDDATGATAEVTIAVDGKISVETTLPKGVSSAVFRIHCTVDASTVAVQVDAEGNHKVIPYSRYQNGIFAVRVEESCRLELVERRNTFSDVSESDWYAGAVQFAAGRELFLGTGDGLFAPNATLTRAMVITVLHRMQGAPAPVSSGGFTDVPADAWYAAAADWAVEMGISNGVGNGRFAPEQGLTREMLAQLLYQCAGAPETGREETFADGQQISQWAQDAMQWAQEAGLFEGDNLGRVHPQRVCSRAEAAAVLERFVAYRLG